MNTNLISSLIGQSLPSGEQGTEKGADGRQPTDAFAKLLRKNLSQTLNPEDIIQIGIDPRMESDETQIGSINEHENMSVLGMPLIQSVVLIPSLPQIVANPSLAESNVPSILDVGSKLNFQRSAASLLVATGTIMSDLPKRPNAELSLEIPFSAKGERSDKPLLISATESLQADGTCAADENLHNSVGKQVVTPVSIGTVPPLSASEEFRFVSQEMVPELLPTMEPALQLTLPGEAAENLSRTRNAGLVKAQGELKNTHSSPDILPVERVLQQSTYADSRSASQPSQTNMVVLDADISQLNAQLMQSSSIISGPIKEPRRRNEGLHIRNEPIQNPSSENPIVADVTTLTSHAAVAQQNLGHTPVKHSALIEDSDIVGVGSINTEPVADGVQASHLNGKFKRFDPTMLHYDSDAQIAEPSSEKPAAKQPEPEPFAQVLGDSVRQLENPMFTRHEKRVENTARNLDYFDVPAQIVRKVRLNLDGGNSEMTIRLKPEHLGEVIFKVEINRGVVSATFKCDNPEVREIIQASLPQLKQEMTGAGLTVNSLNVDSGLGQFFYGEGQEQRHSQHQTSHSRSSNTEQEPAPAAFPGIVEYQVHQHTGIDYRI